MKHVKSLMSDAKDEPFILTMKKYRATVFNRHGLPISRSKLTKPCIANLAIELVGMKVVDNEATFITAVVQVLVNKDDDVCQAND